MNNKVIFLMGPTASGKTELAITLAKCFPIELISVDSVQVYKELHIGAAKPTEDVLTAFPHHLLNIRNIEHPYSAAEFCEDAKKCITAIQGRHKIPLLVGGTMLYFNSLKNGLAPLPSADKTIRLAIAKTAKQKGWPALHHALAQIDPTAAQHIKPNDQQRIQRALEIYQATGKTLTQFLKEQNQDSALNAEVLAIALIPENRTQLHQTIRTRFLTMLEKGLVEEVRALKNNPLYHKDLPAIRSVGYRQIWEHLEGNTDYPTMIEKAITATRQLAKRQMTWLRSWPNICRFDPYTHPNQQIIELVQDFKQNR